MQRVKCKDQNDNVKIKEGKAIGVSPFLHFDLSFCILMFDL